MSSPPPPGNANGAATSVCPTPTIERRTDDALSELSNLGRVSHRLAMTDDGPALQRVLTLLLPRLLSRIGANHARTKELAYETDAEKVALRGVYDKIHLKLVEMLSHAMKRVRNDGDCKVPCSSILELLLVADSSTDVSKTVTTVVKAKPQGTVDPFTTNLSLAFLTLGLPRCDASEVEDLLPGLFALAGAYCNFDLATLSSPAKKSQGHQVAHLVLRAVESIVAGSRQPLTRLGSDASGSSEGDAKRLKASSSSIEAARRVLGSEDDGPAGAVVYDLLLDVLLYQPTKAPGPEGGGSTSTASAVGATATPPSSSSPPPPPPGLSEASHGRLLAGTPSPGVRDWAAEFAPPSRLRDLKLRVLDFVAPCRRWAIFATAADAADDADDDGGEDASSTSAAPSSGEASGGRSRTHREEESSVAAPPSSPSDEHPAATTGTGSGGGDDHLGGVRRRHGGIIGTSRTVALLVVASGDAHPEVAERASSYLRAHMDSGRNATTSSSSSSPSNDAAPVVGRGTTGSGLGGGGGGSGGDDDESSGGGGGVADDGRARRGRNDDPSSSSFAPLLGDAVALSISLLSLALGDNASSTTALSSSSGSAAIITPLGAPPLAMPTNDPARRALVLSTRRRGLGDGKASAACINFVSARILDEHPRIFSAEERRGGGSAVVAVDRAEAIGALSLAVAGTYLGASGAVGGDGSSPLMISSGAGSPAVVAARLVNSLCVRLASLHDALVVSSGNGGFGGADGADSSSDDEGIGRIHRLLARALSVACSVLSSSPPSTGSPGGGGGVVDIRDSCYGVVCTIARSRVATASDMSLFNCGGGGGASSSTSVVASSSSGDDQRASPPPPGVGAVSIATAALLFNCASREEERLRLRAAAALDALLAAYRRLVVRDDGRPVAVVAGGGVVSPNDETTRRRSVQPTRPSSAEGDACVVTTAARAADMSNPWLQMPDSAAPHEQSVAAEVSTAKAAGLSSDSTIDSMDLSRALSPLLWSAARSTQPKASRLASAKWASELIKPLDVTTACHLLCFLSGDTDVTASSVAREGLGLLGGTGSGGGGADDDEFDSCVGVGDGADDAKSGALPEFADIVSAVFPTGAGTTAGSFGSSNSRWARPTYRDFASKGKGSTLRFGLSCLLGDLYGGDDDALDAYLSAIRITLVEYLGPTKSGRGGGGSGREATDLLDEASICLSGCLATSRFARSRMVVDGGDDGVGSHGGDVFGHKELVRLALSANSSRARRYLAKACGHLYEDWSIWKVDTTGGRAHSIEDSPSAASCDLIEWIGACGIQVTLDECATKLRAAQPRTNNPHAISDVHGAAFLGAACVRAFRLASSNLTNSASLNEATADDFSGTIVRCWESASEIVAALGRGTLHADEVIGNACSSGIAISLSYDGVDAPLLEPPLHAGTSRALLDIDSALRRYGNGDHTDAIRAASLAKAAGVALAASTSTAPGPSNPSSNDPTSTDLGHARLQLVDSLFALLGSSANRKDAEIGLIAGEALASFADAYSPEGTTWTTPATEKPEDGFSAAYAAELPPHKHVVYVLLEREIKASSPHKRSACAPAMLALVGRAALVVNNSAAAKKRAFVSEILKNLDRFQAEFVALLSYPKNNHLGRESCCLGLAACRGLDVAASATRRRDGTEVDESSQNLNERLLRAFGQTTNYAASAMMESRSQNLERLRREGRQEGDSNEQSAATMMDQFGGSSEVGEVGGASGVGEAALGSYREMAAAAVSLGRPDLLYSLMLLSVTHPLWRRNGFRDRYRASSLLGKQATEGGANQSEIREALRPHLGKLIPQLLRACNDPNKQTRTQMSALWTSLTGGGAAARSLITDHLLPTIDTLLNDATNKLWRARAGACGALSEVIVGRSWEELGGGGAVINDDEVSSSAGGTALSAGSRLLLLWRVTTRALDDVRITVRESGESLARSVRSLTTRLCDPSAVDQIVDPLNRQREAQAETRRKAESNSVAAAVTALRWLVKYGLNQPCAEATGFCVSSLISIIDVARPSTLEPVLPELIGSLTMAMSSLEPAALNYLQVRAAGDESAGREGNGTGRYDRLERLRLQLAQSGPIAGALNKCLSMMPFISITSQRAVIPQLDSALRCGAGFATRAAAADAASTLCSTCPSAFKNFTGYSSSNPTVRLLRALYFASEREHGAAAKDKMAHALGSLAELAPGHSVRALAVKACDRYSYAMGSNDDPAARRAAAAALRSIAVRASTQFADGGTNDIWCKRVLPMAFLGMKDEDKKVASLWKEVWEEGGTAVDTGSKQFGVSIHEALLPYIVDGCIDALNDVSWARRTAACSVLNELADIGVLAPSPRASQAPPNVIPSKEELLRSSRRAVASNKVLTACAKLIVKSRVWGGKIELLKATVNVAGKWSSLDTARSKLVETSVWGWNDEAGAGNQCPWTPIVHDLCWEDLFVGDGWFTVGSNLPSDDGVCLTQEERLTGTEEDNDDEVDQEAALDFSEGDEMLGDDDTPASGETIDVIQKESDTWLVLTCSGLCRALLEQGLPSNSQLSLSRSDDTLPYRAAALHCLSSFLQSTQGPESDVVYHRYIYGKLAPSLLGHISADPSKKSSWPPLIIARSLECVAAALFPSIGSDIDDSYDMDVFNVAKLAKLFRDCCGGEQPAWTVKEASALAGASLSQKAALLPLRKHDTIATLLECTMLTSKDRKFWRVRCAGLKLMQCLVSRAGSPPDRSSATTLRICQISDTDKDRQLMLEAMLPHKEKILKIAKKSLSDNESSVTAVAAAICGAVAWWP